MNSQGEQQDQGQNLSFDELVSAARGGSAEALGQLIESCRPYLLLVANQDLDDRLRGKLGASDVVQESLIAAQQHLDQFRGGSEQEWRAWVRAILVNDLREARRHYQGTDKRRIEREVSFQQGHRTGNPLDPPAMDLTPGTQAAAQEEAELLRQAIERLPAAYRQVLNLRNWQQLSFAEIGDQMGRTREAARKLWTRALLQLRTELNADEQARARPD